MRKKRGHTVGETGRGGHGARRALTTTREGNELGTVDVTALYA